MLSVKKDKQALDWPFLPKAASQFPESPKKKVETFTSSELANQRQRKITPLLECAADRWR